MDLSSFNKTYPDLDLQKMLSFIEGSLPENEAKAIEQQIKEDPLTAKAVTELEKFYYFNTDAKEKATNYKKVFDQEINNFPEENRSVNNAMVKRISIITAVAASLILVMFYINRSDNKIQTDHYAQYYESYPVINTMRSGPNDDGFYKEGIVNYENKNYTAAITALENVTTKDENYSSAQFYLAQSYMAINDIESALRILSDLSEDSGSIYQSHAKWYMALSFLKQGREKEAKALLKNIAQDEKAFNHSSAKALLNEIDSETYGKTINR